MGMGNSMGSWTALLSNIAESPARSAQVGTLQVQSLNPATKEGNPDTTRSGLVRQEANRETVPTGCSAGSPRKGAPGPIPGMAGRGGRTWTAADFSFG
ncbi:hypothetical protein GCM10011345_12990 [Gemmobacter megaterium]|nr:hypothetical protein GCM10011345_12990 [Gemmobacter megaterium]